MLPPCLTQRELESPALQGNNMKRCLAGLMILACPGAQTQTDDELLQQAHLTISYFQCATLAAEKPVRLSFINRGVKTGRAYFAVIDQDAHRIAKLQMPTEFFVDGPSVDFKLGQVFDLTGDSAMRDFDINGHTGEQYKLETAKRFREKNCALLPK